MKRISNQEVREILTDIFPTADIPSSCLDLKLGDFQEWDSLGNFNLLLAVEERYDIRLDMEEMSQLKSISDIMKLLANRADN